MPHLRLLAGVSAALAALAGPAAAQPAFVAAEVVLTRLGPDRWEADYTFDTPISELDLGPPAVEYRAQAWRVATPGVRLETRDGHERLVAADSARTRIRVLVDRYTEFAHDRYAPLIPFSDGGAALYLGYFTGVPTVPEGQMGADYRFRFAGLPGEHVLPPAGDRSDAYVHFGPQEPVASEHARLVVDPGAPAWLGETLLGVTAAVAGVFDEGLGGGLTVPPLVLVGAGELDAAEGMSVKGGAVGGQFVMLLRGRGLREETAGKRAAFERLVAHELAHLWQVETYRDAYHPAEPWLHEGAAEAMAVHALVASGVWTAGGGAAFAERAAAQCLTVLEGATLADAVRQGRGAAVYPCGFGLYWSDAADPLTLWSRLVERVRAGESYTHATLERVLAGEATP